MKIETMPEYIERRLLLDEVEKVMDEAEYYGEWEDVCYLYDGDILNVIENAPTADVVEVVRCKDCINYNKRYSECTLNGMNLDENGFCSYGKRVDKE